MSVPGPSEPTALKPKSTVSWDTLAFTDTIWLTLTHIRHKMTEATQDASEYTSQPRIVLVGSSEGWLRQRRSGRPSSALNTTAIDWWAKLGARDPSQCLEWDHWQQSITSWRVDMNRLERTYNSFDTKRTTNAGAAEVEQYRPGSISCATAASGKTSSKCSGRRSERPLDGKRADAGMWKFLTISPRKNAIKRWGTSSQLLTSGNCCLMSQRSARRWSAGRNQGVWTGGGLSQFSSRSLFIPIVCTWQIFLGPRVWWVGGESSTISPACL